MISVAWHREKAAAIPTVRTPRTPRHYYYEGIPRPGAAAVDTSYAIVHASFSPFHYSEQRFAEKATEVRARRVAVISVLEF
jgi:hypothetical protein